jgi:hypothetical protein
MTSTDGRSRLLPGPSAFRLNRSLTIVGGAVVLAYVPAFVATITNHLQDVVSWWVIAPLGGLVAALVLQVLAGRVTKRERLAGYTTLRRAHVELDQLDPRSGDVVRKAGEPYLPRRGLFSELMSNDDDRQPIRDSPRPSFAHRATSVAARIGWSVGILVVGAIIWGAKDPVAAFWVWMLAALALVGWVLGLAIGAGVNRSRLTALTEADPHALVFTIISANQFDNALIEIIPDSTRRFSSSRLGVSATAEGLSLWNGRPPEKFGFVPWSWVTSIQADTIYRNRTVYPAVLLAVKDSADGKLVALPLPNPNADRLPLPSKAEASWIASELSQLRSRPSGTKIL